MTREAKGRMSGRQTPLPSRTIDNSRTTSSGYVGNSFASNTEDMKSQQTNTLMSHQGSVSLVSPYDPNHEAEDGISSGVKDLITAINEVELLLDGVKDALPLPRIVAVGDQSSGKSSLIEALSDIHLPKESGTCTRCPIQINLAEGEGDSKWTCKVSFLDKFFYDTDEQYEQSDHALYPWIQRPDSVKHELITLSDKNDVEHIIRLAQVVALTPSVQNPEQYFRKWLNEAEVLPYAPLDFSPNVISLTITAPGLWPLSFYDLPGVINQAPDGSLHSVALIRKLVEDFVAPEHTLVLLAVSMESDIHNSTTSRLLREANADHRCMGVLTKPDRRPQDGDAQGIREVLKNKSFVKGHGYYVTRQPGQSEIKNLDHAGARALEDSYFRSPEWLDIFPGFEDRVGTQNIRKALSNELRKLIQGSLPKVMKMIHSKLLEIDEKIKTLPEPPQDPVRIVSDLTNSLNSCLIKQLDDNFTVGQLRQDWMRKKEEFRQIVLEQKPTLILLSSSESAASCDDDDDVQIVEEPPLKKIKIEAPDSKPKPKPKPSSSKPKPSPSNVSFELDQLRQNLRERNVSSIGMINPKAVDELILSTMQNWTIPLASLLDSVQGGLKNALKQALHTVMGPSYRTSKVHERIESIAKRFLAALFAEQFEKASEALEVELYKPITESKANLDYHTDLELTKLRDARLSKRTWTEFKLLQRKKGKVAITSEERRKITDSMSKDAYVREVEVVAQIKAYYQIAADRFVDRICQIVEFDLFRKLNMSLKYELENGLQTFGPNGYNTCAALLEVDAERALLRTTLNHDKILLKQADQRLQELSIPAHLDDEPMQL